MTDETSSSDQEIDLNRRSIVRAYLDRVSRPRSSPPTPPPETIASQVDLFAGPGTPATPGRIGEPARLSTVENRYQFKSAIGQGGMGKVDLVWDTDLMRNLAVKKILPALADDPELVRDFIREAQVTASLDHPNIVPLHDLGITPAGELYFTMKYLKGMTLQELIERLSHGEPNYVEEYPLPRRFRFFMQVLSGMAAAHDAGILHRDLKPSNVLVGPHGEVSVMDWGLACPLPNSDNPISKMFPPGESGVSGTPHYMSPEQAQGGQALDERSDVYSLGVILYELVALRSPYDATNPLSVLTMAALGEYRSLEEIAPNTPYPLVKIIQKAMALNAPDRYPTAAAFRKDLMRFLDGRHTEAEDAGFVTRWSRWAWSQNRRIARLRVFDFLTLLSGGFFLGMALGDGLARWIGIGGWALFALGAVLTILVVLRVVKPVEEGHH